MSSSTALASIIHLGLDVHKDSVTIAVLPEGAAAPTRIDRYPNDFTKLRRVFERHAKDGELRACYEASGAGYVLQRAMHGWGYHCDVIAPSLIPTKPGVQRKHDKYDAGQLARLYRAGELTVIRIPSEAEERVRDVVRCRETLQREVVKSRHYILKFLARRGFIYRDGTNWRPGHYTWLRQLAGVTSPLASEDLNRSIARHGGQISIVDVRDGNLFIAMSGGCQGCAASSITLRQGFEVMVRRVAPEIVDIVDTTDHGAGAKPFYQRP